MMKVCATCWLTCVDRNDNATGDSSLLFAIHFEDSSRLAGSGSLRLYRFGRECRGTSVRLSPHSLRELSVFLAEQAERANEYLNRYGHASSDNFLRGGAQFMVAHDFEKGNTS